MKNIESIISGLNQEVSSFEEVQGGEDSSVWKIETKKETLALRILPLHGYKQFCNEKIIMDYVVEYGIPVPAIKSVHKHGEYSVMIMEWANGEPLLKALINQPEKARSLGIEFGKTHANIHQIPVKKTLYQDSLWLSPKTETEETLIENILKLNRHSENLSILHLDFHPLNVLTDGETITSVIDWANASVGDIRFDIARTISILQLEGNRIGSPFENYPDILSEFEKGWIKGYEQIAGNQIDLEIFYKWAGYRMLRDLTGKRTENELKIVQEWANKW